MRILLFLVALSGVAAAGRDIAGDVLRLPSEAFKFFHDNDDDSTGTRWAVLIAGSRGFENYRHQADVCHAYQVLRKGGLKDEHIIVFMYDDIANHSDNPRPGVIINNPKGEDVYKGVPKDYTCKDVTIGNVFAAIIGNKSALTGDVISIPKTNENFRLLYDTKGRFRLHSIRDEEAKFKLCKVLSVQFGQKGIPYLNTYDGRTICYPDPLIKANDTIKLDLEANKITDFIKFDVGNVVMVAGGRNRGRVGVIKNREKHKGTFETIHVQDSTGHEFATRLGNVFTIGKGTKPWASLPKGKGIKLSIIEEARKRIAAQAAAKPKPPPQNNMGAYGNNWGQRN